MGIKGYFLKDFALFVGVDNQDMQLFDEGYIHRA